MIPWVKRELVRSGLSQDRADDLEAQWLRLHPNARPWFSDFVLPQVSSNLKDAIDRAYAAAGSLLRTPNLDLILSEIRDQKAILFVGAGFSLDESREDGGESPLTGECIRSVLLELLRPTSNDPEVFATLSLDEIAEHCERQYGRDLLNSRLRDLCYHGLPPTPLPHHLTLATLTCFRFIVTTNWDRLIESAFSGRTGSGKGLHVISRGEQIRDLELDRPTLLKVHGDFDQQRSTWEVPPRITSTDLRNLEFDEPAVFSLLQALALTHRIVVVGFHPSDYTLNRLLQHALLATRSPRQPARPIVVVDPSGTAHLSARFHKPVPVLTTGDIFLDVVKAFVDNEGHAVGHAFGRREGGKSPQHVWAQRTCGLANQVREKYPCLHRVEVVRQPSSTQSFEDVRSTVAKRAGIVLLESLPEKDGRLTLSCGTTLQHLIEILDPARKEFERLTISSTTIPLSDMSHISSPFGLVTLMASRLRGSEIAGRAYQLPAGFADFLIAEEWRRVCPEMECPIAPADGESGAALAAAKAGAERHLATAADPHVFCLGVGSMLDHTTALGGYGMACLQASKSEQDRAKGRVRSERERREIVGRYLKKIAEKTHIVGEVSYRFFRHARPEDDMFLDDREEVARCLQDKEKDRSARFVEFVLRLFHHVITIDVQKIREAARAIDKTVMIVAAKRHKAHAVRALLEGGFANTVIIDQELAHALVSAPPEPSGATSAYPPLPIARWLEERGGK